ncbi:MAG: bifunctional DNA-formamidopyrimidine glycosylase/DNA-(apurinic or apyrimidinic site) lyase, partial [Syntrophomonadaceae bacterium]|nr:bifunctional DNA-formamidopyrimidine glycosylase/DNA-(apurinic or apyrimidinic site) lyase [Syntrophomonadaceae bacterium]
MPELPEVETIKISLQKILGSRINSIELRREDILRSREYELEEIQGKAITAVQRRGKYLLLELDKQYKLLVHMGMSGRFYLESETAQEQKAHVHILLFLDNGQRLAFQDARRFGGIWLLKDTEIFFNQRLGKEPLADDFTAAYLKKSLKGRKIPIKTFLLNQQPVCGLGNIYVDEALFAAGIRPERIADSLTPQEVTSLHRAIRKVLRNSIEQRGTTFRDYRDGFNQKGNFQNHLKVYGKAGSPCP